MRCSLILLFSVASLAVQADVVFMKNGDRITGEIKQIWDQSLVIEPSYANEYSIDLVDVESFQSDGEFDLDLGDEEGGDFSIARSNVAGEILIEEEGVSRSLPLTSLRRLSGIEDYFEWDARLDMNQSLSRGTNDSYIGNLNGELELKWGDHRTIYNLYTTREELDEETTKDSTRLNASYNYLIADKWFVAANISWAEDPIALLDRRVSLSPAIGYGIFDDPGLVLNVQLGAGYQKEEIDGMIESGTVMDWRLRYSHDLFSGDIELFHNHQIYKAIEGRENTAINTQSGLRYEISGDIFLNTQLNFDIDSDPVGDTPKEDLTFVFGVGISF